MVDFVTFKAMLGRHKRGAFMLATIALVLMLGLSAYYKQASITDEEISVRSKESAEVFESVSTDNELSDRIKELVRGLEYPDKVAEDFTRMVMDWKDEKERPILIRWKVELSNAHQDYKERKITRNQVAKIEEEVLEELCETIKKQFSNKTLGFELPDVIHNRQANCLGYSQLIYIIGNAVGLSVRAIDVLEKVMFVEGEGDAKGSHVACIVDLLDSQVVMVDMTWFYEISLVFKLEDYFVKVGNYWELRDQDNPLLIHRRIRLLDRKGLLVGIYNNRGYVYASKGKHDRAILEYNKAIETDPGFSMPYYNRGNTYEDKGEFERAIMDYTKAIEIDPRYANAYCNRGISYAKKGDFERAILDFTKATEIAPRLAVAYFGRGRINNERDEREQAILDYGKAIEINPKYAEAYNNRGVAYYEKEEYDRAILDFEKAIELNPKDAMAYTNRGITFDVKGEHDRAIIDYTKAIELNPKDAVAYLYRAEVYAKLGKSEEAKKDLLKALELDPELRESVKKISEQYELDLKLD